MPLAYGGHRVECDALSEKGAIRLKTRSTDGGTVWEGLGATDLLEEVCAEVGIEVYRVMPFSVYSLPPTCRSRCKLSAVPDAMPLL